MENLELEKKIEEYRNTLKADRLDMSLGEILSMYEDNALIISPEYQRAFRWEKYQQSRFIESLLLGIPIPPIFVAEDSNGKWELVDGLQRVSTILSFFGKLKDPNKNNLKLEEGDLLGTSLTGITIDLLPLKFKYTLKRAIFRVEILRWDSSFEMRYELFNRLNTGGTALSEQEIRNCVFIGEFNKFIHNLAQNDLFKQIIKINEKQEAKMKYEELVLRYFAVIHGDLDIKKNMQEYLSLFMKKVINKNIILDFQKEESLFLEILNFLVANCNSSVFGGGNGAFSENYYDTILYILNKKWDVYSNLPEEFNKNVEILKLDQQYADASGYKNAWGRRLIDKLKRAEEIFSV